MKVAWEMDEMQIIRHSYIDGLCFSSLRHLYEFFFPTHTGKGKHISEIDEYTQSGIGVAMTFIFGE